MIKNKRQFLGILLIAIGAIVLLNRAGFIPEMFWWLPKWYTLVLAIGIFNLLIGKRTLGIILTIVGITFLAGDTDLFNLNWSYVWPTALIGLGVLFLFRNSLSGGSKDEVSGEPQFDTANILGGGKQIVTSSPFKGGKVTSIMGGSEIDLTKATLTENAVIDVFTIMGASHIKVPDGWNVAIEVTSIMGGFEDKRNGAMGKEGPTLKIKGLTIMGGGEINS